jgi:ABC-type nickel/cobalt efflux system permease component RcnA
MLGIDDRIAELGASGSVLVALAVAVLLGLRHATDPDHLTAVATLALADRVAGGRRGLRLGLAWGVGHAVAIVALGLPVVLLSQALPDGAQRVAEGAIGVLIIVLAARLLWRWRRGYLHAHLHEHDGVWHAHPHAHENGHEHAHGAAHRRSAHDHAHADDLGRTPRAAFAVGLAHGVGGSAGVSILLLGAISSDVEAVVALLLFAVGTAVSMAAATGALGRLLATRAAQQRLAVLSPGFGSVSLLFGAWYALGAAGVVAYPL